MALDDGLDDGCEPGHDADGSLMSRRRGVGPRRRSAASGASVAWVRTRIAALRALRRHRLGWRPRDSFCEASSSRSLVKNSEDRLGSQLREQRLGEVRPPRSR